MDGSIFVHNTGEILVFYQCHNLKSGMNLILLCLLFSALLLPLSAVVADTEITLQCEGRGAVSVVFAGYGLVTESWSPSSFETGTRGKDEHLPSGRPVAVWRFSNGDRLFQVKDTTGWFAIYRGDHPEILRQCVLQEQRVLQPENLLRVPYR